MTEIQIQAEALARALEDRLFTAEQVQEAAITAYTQGAKDALEAFANASEAARND